MNSWTSGTSGLSTASHSADGVSYATADLSGGVDPVEAYFECISTCSLDDGECITVCTQVLRDNS
ncbi:MAG: hypothetical protein VKN15_04590 [Cyanobacteriota bacterium]|nr:hypothetical protein [Cyanobacteriota bacterium]